MSVSEKFPVIRRSKGVVMSGYNFLKKCYSFRRTADFADTIELDPPIGVKPSPPWLVGCRWEPEIEGVILTIEEPEPTEYQQLFDAVTFYTECLARMKKESPDATEAITELERDIEDYRQRALAAQSEGKDIQFDAEENRIILWSEIQRILLSDGIITARIDLPFTNPLKNPDGSDKIGTHRGRLMELGFSDLPASNRRLFPSGFAHLADLSQATIRFRAETISAHTTHHGALASFGSSNPGVKTPLKTHPAALDLLTRARLLKKQYTKNKHTKVIRHQIEEGK